ncbi:fumarylpyruvate hydrolase [Brevibacterium sandarakinum]|uniref:Fumarylpyruvate hydrolase n=1 Tax=Brevibacterium sandarakinum TaxID=629680 RepID=A0A1H1NUS1_BRESA|nr:fumarylacetoacetate hydrolase family protein [Brevibacterium sandarakinum]SDS02731.1 fumarylpyruvate hydrolase [Brevibacterium sandarakinum]
MNPKWSISPKLIPILDSQKGFPVRRIYCVGRNYVDHIQEMREGDERDDPFFFQKPGDAVELDGAKIPYPPATRDLQYEGELVVAIGHRFRNQGATDPMEAVFGFAAGIDLTRRDLQKASVAQARPWEPGKSFDRSAPCGTIVPRDSVTGIDAGTLTVDINGEERQKTRFDLMIWAVPEIVAQLSALYTLEPGDLIFTGTPAGVSALNSGDRIHVEITGLPSLTISITDQEES